MEGLEGIGPSFSDPESDVIPLYHKPAAVTGLEPAASSVTGTHSKPTELHNLGTPDGV